MAIIKPFKALKFNENISGSLVSLISAPYDVINDEDYSKYIKKNKYNIVKLELPKGSNAYNNAKNTLDDWIQKKVLVRDKDEAIYIYEEEFQVSGITKSIKGIICLVKLEEFEKKIILPHEETLSKAKEDRLNLLKATSCNFSQIYSLYSDEIGNIPDTIEKYSKNNPDINVTDSDDITHRIWTVSDKSFASYIAKQFENKKLYIADGHHRYETAINYRNYCRKNSILAGSGNVDYVMMMLVDIDSDGLVVFPTHRLLNNLDKFDYKETILKCRDYFDVEEKYDIKSAEKSLQESYKKHETSFIFYSEPQRYVLLTLKKDINIKRLFKEIPDSVSKLDVTVLHKLILEKIFGIDGEKMKKQSNLSYTRNISEAIDSVNKNESQCAFILNPTRVSEIKDVALSGEKMPQKSTYFYPKLITGLVINKID